MKKKTGPETRMAGAPLRPEDSRWYHPTLNPTGAPPPGKVGVKGRLWAGGMPTGLFSHHSPDCSVIK